MNIDETVDRESQQKLYTQVYSIFKGKIEKGDWTPVSQIPTEDDLCKTYEVSKSTVRVAISELVREGYLKRWQGKGTFVINSSPDLGLAMKTRLTEDMFGEGVRAHKEVLAMDVKEPANDIKKYLKAEGDVHHIFCKRVVNGDLAYVEEFFIPVCMMPALKYEDIRDCSFYSLVQERAARKIMKVVQNIEVAVIKGDAAAILKLEEGSPVLLIHRLLICVNGSPIAYTRLYGSGRKYRIQNEFERLR